MRDFLVDTVLAEGAVAEDETKFLHRAETPEEAVAIIRRVSGV